MRFALIAALLVLLAGAALAHEGEKPAAEPVETHRYVAPAAGSYELPPLKQVTAHRLRGSDGADAVLPMLEAGQVAFVAFVYLSCSQASGCPHALAVLQRLDREIAADLRLAGRVRLYTVSFDPERDTPERLSELREGLRPRSDWSFLTAENLAGLRPLLRDYDQDLTVLRNAAGDPTGELRHVLKLFLVDSNRQIRNIYSTGFLDLRLLQNDALTLLAPVSAPAD